MSFRKIVKLLYCYIAGNKKNNLTIQQPARKCYALSVAGGYNNNNPQKGFTLIELMVVLSITAILGTIGIAGFSTYNQIQVLQTAASDVASVLNLAKSRSQSQVKSSALCSSLENLDGYKVVISAVSKSYVLKLVCSGVDKQVDEEVKVLPSDLSFDANKSFFFPVQTGGVQAAGQIVISNSGGKTKTVTINSLGGVNVQ